MRAVFDTNVVLSALVFGGRLRWLRRAWGDGRVTPIVCRETTAESLRVLAYPKFRLDDVARGLLLADYLPFSEVAALPSPWPDVAVACRDRDDAMFLHLAIVSDADFLVSGDTDRAVLSAAYRVVAPGSLRQRLEAGV
jgi:hypothetical protein